MRASFVLCVSVGIVDTLRSEVYRTIPVKHHWRITIRREATHWQNRIKLSVKVPRNHNRTNGQNSSFLCGPRAARFRCACLLYSLLFRSLHKWAWSCDSKSCRSDLARGFLKGLWKSTTKIWGAYSRRVTGHLDISASPSSAALISFSYPMNSPVLCFTYFFAAKATELGRKYFHVSFHLHFHFLFLSDVFLVGVSTEVEHLFVVNLCKHSWHSISVNMKLKGVFFSSYFRRKLDISDRRPLLGGLLK